MMALVLCFRRTLAGSLLAFVSLSLWAPGEAQAYPVFARQYEVSCSTCHIAIPRRNDFGDAFRKAGYRMPQPPLPDEELEEAGAVLPRSIEMRGNSLLVTDFPAMWIFGAVGSLATQYTNDPSVEPPFGIGTPALELVFGAALAEHVSVLGQWSVRAPPRQFFLHFARLFDTPALNVLVGRFEQTKTLFRTNDSLLSVFRIDSANINGYVVGEARSGVELNGIVGRRGFYAVGISQEDANGPSFHGHYQLSVRLFGLDFLGEPADIDLESEASFTDDLSITLAQWGTIGRVGEPGEAATSEIRRLGFDAKVMWRRFSLWSGIMLGGDQNLTVDRRSDSVTGFAEISYAVTDWLIPLYLYQYVDTATERRMFQSHEVGAVMMLLENLRVRLLGGFTDDKLENEVVELQVLLGM